MTTRPPDTPAGGLPDRPRPIPLDSVAIAWHLRRTFALTVKPSTVRSWGQRGKITRLPATDGGYRYDLAEVLAYLELRGTIDTRPRA